MIESVEYRRCEVRRPGHSALGCYDVLGDGEVIGHVALVRDSWDARPDQLRSDVRQALEVGRWVPSVPGAQVGGRVRFRTRDEAVVGILVNFHGMTEGEALRALPPRF